MDELLARLTAASPPDRTVTVVALVVAVLAYGAATTRPLRHVVTLVHEAGHVLAALLCGRKLAGMRLHRDASGLATSRGRSRGPGAVFTLFAGYPAPSVLGLLGVAAVVHGYVGLWLFGLVLLCVLLLLQIRNLFGVWVLAATALSLGVVGWYAPDDLRAGLGLALAVFLAIGGPWGLLNLGRTRRAGTRGSDVDMLARITTLPAGVWAALMWLVVLVSVGSAGWLVAARLS